MSDANRLRVGVIGCGGIAQMMHLPYLQSLADRFELVALSDLSKNVMQKLGVKYNVPEQCQFTRYRDLLALDLDAVLILTSGNHYAQIKDALQAGKHVLVEKPMCFTLREADECIALAARVQRNIFVGNMKRYDPGYQYAQRQIQNLPDIRYVQINTLHPAESGYVGIYNLERATDIAPDMIAALREADDASARQAVGDVSPSLRGIYGDVLLGSMVHDVNALRGLFGEPEHVLFSQLWPPDQTDVCITTVLLYPHEMRVVYTWAYLAELRDYFEEIAVMASKGRVRIQFPSPFLRHFPTPVVVQGMDDGASFTKNVIASYDEAFRQELVGFYDCIVHGVPAFTDAASARQDLLVLQKIFAHLHPQGLGGEAAQTL
jgi:predicted dehydrogenase